MIRSKFVVMVIFRRKPKDNKPSTQAQATYMNITVNGLKVIAGIYTRAAGESVSLPHDQFVD